MICKLIVVSLFFCCAINCPEPGIAKVPCRSKKIDTLLLSSHQPAVNVEAIDNITPTPTARKTPVSANNHKVYHTKTRREKIALVSLKVRKIQAQVDKIEAQIREVELRDQ